MCADIQVAKSFSTRSGRRKHQIKCTFPLPESSSDKTYIKNDGKIQCCVCDAKFSHINNFYRHHKNKHTEKKKKEKEVRSFPCSTCDKVFGKMSKLARHEQIHKKSSTYECEKCSKKFSRQKNFQKHKLACENLLTVKFPSHAPISEYNSSFGYGDCEHLFATGNSTDLPQVIDTELEGSMSGSMVSNGEELSYTIVLGNNEDGFHIHNEQEQVVPIEDDSTEECSEHDSDVGHLSYNYLKQTKYREKADLVRALNKFKEKLPEEIHTEVLQNSLNETGITMEEETREHEFGESVLECLRNLNLLKSENRNFFCTILHQCYGEQLFESEELMSWLAVKLNRRSNRVLQILKSWKKEEEARGRKSIPLTTKQQISDLWHENSITTVDRRNNRDFVSMPKAEYEKLLGGIVPPSDIKVEEYQSKRNVFMVRVVRKVATKTVRQMQALAKKKIGSSISLGMVYNCKPFYIVKPTEREKESCLCKFCLNLRLAFQAYQALVRDKAAVTSSMSEFFANGIKCEADNELGFSKLECIDEQCANEECYLSRKLSKEDLVIPEDQHIKYYQFIVIKYMYKSKKDGKEKEGSRTVRKEMVTSIEEFEDDLYSLGRQYLLHRYECKNDQHHWPLILSNGLGATFHLDYSENLSTTPKYEPQDSHFNNKQTSLHCAVVYLEDGNGNIHPTYAFHFSDDKTHDNVFTEAVVRDLLRRYPSYSAHSVLRLKSDNCTAQYCCRYLFWFYQVLAREINMTIIIYFGINGHGRGLVDACSSFGVKGPLRRAIITRDYYYETTDGLIEFLEAEQIEKADEEKYYYAHLDSSEWSGKRSSRSELIIIGCQKMRMISFFPNGYFQTRRHMCSCQKCSLGRFNECSGNMFEETLEMADEIQSLDEEIQPLDEEISQRSSDMYSFSEPGAYVAVYSEALFKLKAFETFHLVLVQHKGEATEDMVDFNGQTVAKGSLYLEGFHLEKVESKKKKNRFVQYRLIQKQKVFVDPGQVFCPAVAVNEELQLSIEDYLFLCDSISR